MPISISNRVSLLAPTAVNSILAEVRQAQARGIQTISLMRGEPDLATPVHIVEAAQAALTAGRTGYPDNRGEMRLREAVALKLQRDNGAAYDPAAEILVTTGATFGIHAALMALLNDGDHVLLPDPVYDAYQSPIRLAGGVPVPIASTPEGGRFTLNMEALDRAARHPRARVILINTPWNPVGTVLSESELGAIGRRVVDHKLALISDEIYETILYGAARHISPASLSPELRERTVIVNSLSKTYAMTGWRVGYCAAPKPVTDAMFLVLQQSSRGPATFIQDAAAAALSGPQETAAAMRDIYAARRTQVRQAFEGHPRARALPPEGGFFAMVDVRATGLPSNEVRRRLLHEHGVVVAHGSAYGPSGEGTLRVSFASGGATLANGLARLTQGLAAL
ncbi:MAG: aminotransferase class I/II-fold pyridoxal phosphate-dependent enzyme [Acidobacteria bacterium]|nr:aminotransferase class I/II-fold pyridoxal phosphate-dependent enzyme [Acidobacteriota bacterium]